MSIGQLQALQACIKATDELTAVINNNREITHRNTSQTHKYSVAHTVWSRRKQDHDNKVNRWKNRTDEFEKFKNYGISEDFKIEWGGAGENATEDCKACAKRSLEGGWWNKDGKMAKNIGWAGQDQVCELSPGNSLLGWDGYIDDSNASRWGWHSGFAGSRKWWTCMKSQNKKDKELGEYNSANPGNFTEPEPKDKEGEYAHDPTEPTPTAAINCCSNLVNVNLADWSSADLSNINQSCQQSIQQRLNEVSSNVTAPPVSAALTAAPAAAPVTLADEEEVTLAEEEVEKVEEVDNQATDNKKTQYLLAGGGLFSLSFIFVIFIILSSVLLAGNK